MVAPPSGTVTFLFTDIEGSTHVIQAVGDSRYARVLVDHRRLLLEAFHAGEGRVVDSQGDGFLVVFQSAKAAILAAVAGQRALTAHRWVADTGLRVRMGLHTGEPTQVGDGYVGIDVHRAARICSVGYGGQTLISQTARAIAGDDFMLEIGFRDLGEHRLKDLALPQRLYQVIIPGLPSDFPPLRSLSVLSNNLPVQLTTFVGREREMADVMQLIRASHLLNLTGPGGGGKTRLALQVAAEILPENPDGVWLVELAALTDPAFVPQAVAAALSVRAPPGRSFTATLVEYLRSRKLLLILDNCEQVINACTLLAEELLHACPDLRILVTSREALGIRGEVLYVVPSLSLPEGGRPSVDVVQRSEAGSLFIDRASLARPGYTVRDDEAGSLVQICRRLDGNPLAIELAAARANVLSVEQIAARLDDLFHLLTDGGRTTLPRHKTLQAAIDWSYDLLTEHEKVVFRRLSAFAGGWTLAAAESVCAGDGIAPPDVLDLLARLVEKSLVIAESPAGEFRYRMLETIREYSRSKLVESGEAASIYRRHLDWFLSVAELAKPELRGTHLVESLNQLSADHDNFRVALETSLKEGTAAEALRLAGALVFFWYRRSYFTEGKVWLGSALARAGSVPAPLRAEALFGAGQMEVGLSDYDAAWAFNQQSLQTFRELGDTSGTAHSVHGLGRVAEVRGDYTSARPFYEESLEIFRESDDKRGVAVALIDLGRVTHMQGEIALSESLLEQSLALSKDLGEELLIGATLHAMGWVRKDRADYGAAERLLKESYAIFHQLGDERYAAWSVTGLGAVSCRLGKYDEACRFYEDSLQVFREVGDRHRMAESLLGLGDVTCALGDLDASRRHYEDSLSLYRKLNHTWGCAEALGGLGWVALGRGDHVAAASFLEQSLRLSREVGHQRSSGSVLRALGRLALLVGEHRQSASYFREALVLLHKLDEKYGVVACLEGLAAVATCREQGNQALRLYGTTATLRERLNAPLPPSERAGYDHSLHISNQLAEPRARTAWSDAPMTLDQAVAYALRDDATPPAQMRQSV